MCAICKDVNVTRRADFIYLIMENGKWAPMKMPDQVFKWCFFGCLSNSLFCSKTILRESEYPQWERMKWLWFL